MNKYTHIRLIALFAMLLFAVGCGSVADANGSTSDTKQGRVNTGADINTGTINVGGADVNELGDPTSDLDGDGILDVDDPDMDGDGIPNEQDPDMDGDGILNVDDPDMDGDGVLNINDADMDGDGILNEQDNDMDGDGIANEIDSDMDGDGIDNLNDNDMDGDGIPNEQDPDMDGDGIPNDQDPDIDGDGYNNGDDNDIDGDGIPNEQDPDIDGDGIPNEQDPTPNGTVNDSGTTGEGFSTTASDTQIVVATVPATIGTGRSSAVFLDFADVRQEISDQGILLSSVEISKITIRGAASAQTFLEANATVRIILTAFYQNSLEIVHSPSVGDSVPVQTFGTLQSGLVLNESLFEGTALGTFRDLIKDESNSGENIIIETEVLDLPSNGGDIDLEFIVTITGLKSI